ncbi:RING-H2 finger protein ATL45 [Morus notabilis]|uniref:RING-H2 finger protein ATL45 n=1 Tax=Morus notabilis TaxID=981085 RepID=W9S4U1_9ROSA|nr:RING-H2 finger protein ATL56 [Morus notabilis]EXC10653.1 RING-H2 finger protein ATL45 [Morus notabilis]
MDFPSPPPVPFPSPPPPPIQPATFIIDVSLYKLILFFLLFLFVSIFAAVACDHRNRQQQLLQARRRRPQPTGAPSAAATIICTFKLEQNPMNTGGGDGGSDCAICLENFKYGDECRIFVACNHGFHRACIDKWLDRDHHCPLCRASVRGGRTINLDQV